MDVRVNIVGFAVDEVVLKETFREWARVGNGGYFDAQNGEQLKNAMRATLRPTYQVLAGGKVISTGTVNGDPIEIPAGSLQGARFSAPPPRTSVRSQSRAARCVSLSTERGVWNH